MAKVIKLKENTQVVWKGRTKTLFAGVEYRNLPKDVLDQIPTSAKPATRKRKA